jgi:lipopolysaccharide/colanic/teichoic acid biosynthesis glycosyltransferase
MKRSFDFALASFSLLALGPLLCFFALWIRLNSSGPVFYRGTRVGRRGHPFRIYKFRSMVVGADKIGPSSTAVDDRRTTSPGRLMRRLKIDELPQLLNVFAGEMSFVGPRPQVQWAVDLYSPEERHLLDIRPGITDYASLRFRNEGEILAGSADPDRDYLLLIAPLKIRLGLYYVRTNNVLVDMKIIVATALSVAGVDPEWCLPRDVAA